MNAGCYDSEAEGMKSLDSRRPWETPIESEPYDRLDAAWDERDTSDSEDEGDEDIV